MASKTTDESSSSSSSSSSFEKRLTLVNGTQESVQTLSLWMLHHHSQHEHLVKTWFKVLKKSKSSHRLTLFYVANDVIQNAKRHHALVYQQSFKPFLNSAMTYVKDNAIKKKIQRILEIWRERGVYDDDFIDELLKKLVGPEVLEKDKETTRVIAEFQPKNLCETLLRFKQIEGETLIKEQIIANDLKLIETMSVENVRKLKDKTSTDAYRLEYENSRDKFQDYIRHFEGLLKERKTLKRNCEQAEIFYDAQYSDANIVVEAYKNFGEKVATLKRKLDNLIRDLPETVSPPNADNVPSPGNTPPDYRTTDMDLSDNEENDEKSPSVVRTTRADPRHHRKHVHTRHTTHFDDADERPHHELSKSSTRLNGEKKTTSETPMIDVNAITELLIQHSQSTGFDKSLEMLTQTLRQLTDPNVNALPQTNPLENLLMKSLQTPPISAPPVLPTSMWFNPTATAAVPPPATTYPSPMPTYFPPQTGQRSNSTSLDFHSQQQFSNQRH